MSNRSHFLRPQATGVEIDVNHWHEEVHLSVDYKEHVARDDRLRELLVSLPQEKWIFTNADVRHAEAILAILGVRDCFKASERDRSLRLRPVPTDGIRIGPVLRSEAALCASPLASKVLICFPSPPHPAGPAGGHRL